MHGLTDVGDAIFRKQDDLDIPRLIESNEIAHDVIDLG